MRNFVVEDVAALEHMVEADLETLERLLQVLNEMRDEGQFTPLYAQSRDAIEMLARMSFDAPYLYCVHISDLAHRYHVFLRSILH